MHHSSLFIINHHHSSPFIITQHPSSLFIIIHHHSSSFIITHHPASSLIIFIYYFIRYKLRHGTVLGDCRPQYNDIWELRCELRAPGMPYTMCTCRRQIPEEDARGGHRILALLRLPFPSVHRWSACCATSAWQSRRQSRRITLRAKSNFCIWSGFPPCA